MSGVRQREVEARWTSWDGTTDEVLRLGWESGGWTADGAVRGVDVHYALRVDQDWNVRQFLLFRDLDEPDLWLARDRQGRWGEVNGSYRSDLQGCTDVALDCSPFPVTVPVRRLGAGLVPGEGAELLVAVVDVVTLQVAAVRRRYTRLGPRRWREEAPATGEVSELEVDDAGLVLDRPGAFRRVA